MDAAVQARKARLKLAAVESGRINAAHLLDTCKSILDNRSRIEALVGVVTDVFFSKVYRHFKFFLTKLRKEEENAKKRGGVMSDEFYARELTCESVFGDSTLRFASSSASLARVSSDNEVAKLMSKGLSNFSKCCITLPTTPVSHFLTSRLSKSRSLNDAKRKVIHDLRTRIRMLRFELASVKRQHSPTFRKNGASDRKELDRMRRELEEKDDENRLLRERVEELLSQKKVITKINGKFTPAFHDLLIHLISLGIADAKINETIRSVSQFCGMELTDFPSLFTIRSDALALLSLAMMQVRELLETADENACLISDETKKKRQKYQTYLVSTSRDAHKSNILSLGVVEVATKSAEESLEAFKSRLNRIELVTSGTETGSFLQKVISSISSTMSDRASTQTLFNSLLRDFKSEIVPKFRSDWDSLSFSERESALLVSSVFCQLHITASMGDIFFEVMRASEEKCLGETVSESSLLFVLRTLASHFSDRGAAKFHQVQKWLVFVNSLGLTQRGCVLPSFDGNRFNISFAIAAQVFHVREMLVNFIDEHCTDCESLVRVRALLRNELILSQLKVCGIVDCLITGPLIRLAEHSGSILDTRFYVGEMLDYLRACAGNPTKFISCCLPTISCFTTVMIFKFDSPLFLALKSSPSFPTDEKHVRLISNAFSSYLSAQYVDFLPGGKFSHPSPAQVESLSTAPSTSRSAESVFSITDRIVTQSPNTRSIRMDAFVMSRMNKTLNWLDGMSLNNKALILEEALKKRKILAQIGVVDRIELARKIKRDMEEKAKEIREREERAFQRKSEISATVQQKDGYWLSEASMKVALDGIRTKTAQIAALKAQIKYRKEVLCQPAPRPDIYKLQPKGVKLNVERLTGILTELITASAITTSQKRILPDWEGRTVERVVKERSGAITVVEGKIDSVFERDDMHHVRIIYDDGGCEELLLDELEDEFQSGNGWLL